jgi:signal transduction histidine kinase
VDALHLARRYAFDAAVVALAAVLQLEIWREGRGWQIAVAALFATLPLLLASLYPLPAVLIAVAALAYFGSPSAPPAAAPDAVYDTNSLFIAALFAAWVAGVNADRVRAVAGLVAVLALGVFVTFRFPDEALTDYVWIVTFLGATWAVAFLLRQRADALRVAEERARVLEQASESEALQAVADERARIARELHDVVAHSVSVMTVQAGGVRRLLRAEQEREREALQTIEETGRQALAEMRRLLGILRQPTEQAELSPQPGLERLDDLLGRVRAAGLPVEFEVAGAPVALPPGVDVSAYRIVQEALTNALRHAGPARATVRIAYEADAVALEITNDGRADGDGGGSGHGLAGMRERIAVYGGRLDSGPVPGGGYAVRARLPLAEPAT